MKYNINFKMLLRKSLSVYLSKIMCLIVIAIMILHQPIQAQELNYTRPSLWFGAAAGANFNYYRGSTHQLNSSFTPPVTFHNANSVGLYLAPLVEYHNPESIFGFMFQAGFDGRNATYSHVITPCNCPADLSTNLSYITLEPSLRLAPFKSHFYLFGGPRLAFNVAKAFTYKLGINPAYPDQEVTPDVKGDLSDVKSTLLSMQVGAGYDISLSSQNHRTQFVISPFVAYHPYFGQSPRSIETWNINTLRVGAAFKFGFGKKMPIVLGAELPDPIVRFSVIAPKNIPTIRKVREIFPLRNYVFFDLGSTQIPDRYELINKNQVKDFKEDQLDMFVPKNMSGRSQRQMIVYYNVLNILGDRMNKNTAITINLVGSSDVGPQDGMDMAESVKQYLVGVFSINPSRIETEGKVKPKIPSEQPGATRELELLRAGDRRVSIESKSPELLMEFQNGSSTLLKSVEIMSNQEAPLDSYVTFNADGAMEGLKSWSMEITDDKNVVQKFGPFYQDLVRIPGKSILGTRLEGNYKVKMIGLASNGNTVIKDTKVHMVLWTPTQEQEGKRYSILYEFNESNAISMYDKYLTDIIVPKIPTGGTVYIHGYTDIIGDEAYNLKLSLARANDVKKIIESALLKQKRSDVNIEIYGFGEDESMSPFNNTFPEDRFYNRTVILDIVPKN